LKLRSDESLSNVAFSFNVRRYTKGVEYKESMETGWKPPSHIRGMTETDCEAIRDKWHIIVEGERIPPPILTFKDMKAGSCSGSYRKL
jgi:ATP-dependent RNA helicase DDX41